MLTMQTLLYQRQEDDRNSEKLSNKRINLQQELLAACCRTIFILFFFSESSIAHNRLRIHKHKHSQQSCRRCERYVVLRVFQTFETFYKEKSCATTRFRFRFRSYFVLFRPKPFLQRNPQLRVIIVGTFQKSTCNSYQIFDLVISHENILVFTRLCSKE